MELNTIKPSGTWGKASSDINENFSKTSVEVDKLKSSFLLFKGFFLTESSLKIYVPSPRVGDYAYVGEVYPGVVYACRVSGQWHNTGDIPQVPAINMADLYTKSEGTQLENRISEKISNLGLDYTFEKDGYYINLNGIQVKNSLFICTDYIPVTPGGTLSTNVVTGTSGSFSFYDSERVFIRAIIKASSDMISYPIPDTAYYVRLGNEKSKQSNPLIAGNVFPKTIKDKIDSINNTIYYDGILKGYIDKLGVFVANSVYSCTDYAPVVKGGIVYMSSGVKVGSQPIACALYDEEKVFVKELISDEELTSDGYIRFCSESAGLKGRDFGVDYTFSDFYQLLKKNSGGNLQNAGSNIIFSKITSNGYLNKQGQYSALADYSCTDFVTAVEGTLAYIASTVTVGNSAISCAFYDSDKVFVKSLLNGEKTPSAGYVRFCAESRSVLGKDFGLEYSFDSFYQLIEQMIGEGGQGASSGNTIYLDITSNGYLNRQGQYVSLSDYSCTDYAEALKGGSVFLADYLSVGGSAISCALYDSSKVFLKSMANGEKIPSDGFIRFCAETRSIRGKDFGLDYTFSDIFKLVADKTSLPLNLIKKADLFDSDYICRNNIGLWTTRRGAQLTFDSIEKAMIISYAGTSKSYAGAESATGSLPIAVNRIARFEAKGISGNYADIRLDRAGFEGVNLNLTTEWKTYTVNVKSVSSGNAIMAILSYSTGEFSIGVRNFYYADEGTWGYDYLSNVGSESATTNTFVDTNTDSINRIYIENKLSDMGIPSWVGKLELKTSELMPSINNAGQAYLIEKEGELELHIVKDAIEIVGCTLVSKSSNEIISKSFSVCHFGDSITAGVGSDANHYVKLLKSKLEADGHTITKQTNLGIGSSTADSLNSAYAGKTPDHHDFATLMIGINDQDRWLRNQNTDWQAKGLNSEGFRDWYRTSLLKLIQTIKNYSTCTKLFLIVPYRSVCIDNGNGTYNPSKEAYFSRPLHDIIIQENIRAAENDTIIHLCRGDYYVPVSRTYVSDGLHPSAAGAEVLAVGVRNEITFRV